MTTDDVDMKTPQAILQIAPPTGKIPVKIVLMGVPGVGKTTLAAQFPNPIFLDVEQSTTRMKPQPARLPNTLQPPPTQTPTPTAATGNTQPPAAGATAPRSSAT